MGEIAASASYPSSFAAFDELESLSARLPTERWKVCSATVEPESERVDIATLRGDLGSDSAERYLNETGELRSLVVKTEEGELVRFTLHEGSVEVHRDRESVDQSDSEISGSETVYFVVTVLLYAMWSVDCYIDRNGLRPVIDEVKERRWTITLACAILTTFCQIGNC